NYPGKFPHPRLHHFYWHGASLGEAYLRSAQYLPFQIVLYGDPICRPFSHIPQVTIPDLPTGAASGAITIRPGAGTSHPSAGIGRIDLYINGILYNSGAPGAAVRIDTTALPEGASEIVAVAIDDTDVESSGRF